jgi:hypothetical protein
MKIMEIGCPWGYIESDDDDIRTCVPNRAMLGLGDIAPPSLNLPPGFGIERPASVPIEVWDPVGTQATKQAQAGFAARLNAPVPASDYSWLLYVGLAVGALVLLSKGKR